jgi:hypothetical protein
MIVVVTQTNLTQIIMPYRVESLSFLATLTGYNFVIVDDLEDIPKLLINSDNIEAVISFWYDYHPDLDEEDIAEFRYLEFVHQFKLWDQEIHPDYRIPANRWDLFLLNPNRGDQ